MLGSSGAATRELAATVTSHADDLGHEADSQPQQGNVTHMPTSVRSAASARERA